MAQPKVKLLSFKELGLDYGQVMGVMPNPGDTRQSVEAAYVGCMPGKSVLVGFKDTDVLTALTQHQKIVLRVCLASGVALFPSTVLSIQYQPHPIVFLEYPRDIKFKQVRGASRVNVIMPILASNKNNRPGLTGLAGKILDISTTGARIEIFNKLGEVGDEVEVKGKFKVGSITRMLTLNAVIRMHNRSAEGHIYGVEFCEGDEDNLLVLLGYTFHEIAFGELQTVR